MVENIIDDIRSRKYFFMYQVPEDLEDAKMNNSDDVRVKNVRT